jgi:predicted Zn-dependent peptidase
VEAAVYEELDRLARTPPTEAELERVRRRLEASDVRRLASNLGLAFQLAESTARFDDWRRTFQLSARLAQVTPEDVQRVVRTYFTPENRTVATLARPEQGQEHGR